MLIARFWKRLCSSRNRSSRASHARRQRPQLAVEVLEGRLCLSAADLLPAVHLEPPEMAPQVEHHALGDGSVRSISAGISQVDVNGQGTHVAGTIAAIGNNGIGYARLATGLALDAPLAAARVDYFLKDQGIDGDVTDDKVRSAIDNGIVDAGSPTDLADTAGSTETGVVIPPTKSVRFKAGKDVDTVSADGPATAQSTNNLKQISLGITSQAGTYAGAGRDLLIGGLGNDGIVGGTGQDSIDRSSFSPEFRYVPVRRFASSAVGASDSPAPSASELTDDGGAADGTIAMSGYVKIKKLNS